MAVEIRRLHSKRDWQPNFGRITGNPSIIGVREGLPTTRQVRRGVQQQLTVSRYLSASFHRVIFQFVNRACALTLGLRCRPWLRRMKLELRMRQAQHPFVEPTDDVFKTFDAMPGLARARELIGPICASIVQELHCPLKPKTTAMRQHLRSLNNCRPGNIATTAVFW